MTINYKEFENSLIGSISKNFNRNSGKFRATVTCGKHKFGVKSLGGMLVPATLDNLAPTSVNDLTIGASITSDTMPKKFSKMFLDIDTKDNRAFVTLRFGSKHRMVKKSAVRRFSLFWLMREIDNAQGHPVLVSRFCFKSQIDLQQKLNAVLYELTTEQFVSDLIRNDDCMQSLIDSYNEFRKTRPHLPDPTRPDFYNGTSDEPEDESDFLYDNGDFDEQLDELEDFVDGLPEELSYFPDDLDE